MGESIAGSFNREKELHKKFYHLRAQGEFFRITGELEGYINFVGGKVRKSENSADVK
jgi:hypothetical protein